MVRGRVCVCAPKRKKVKTDKKGDGRTARRHHNGCGCEQATTSWRAVPVCCERRLVMGAAVNRQPPAGVRSSCAVNGVSSRVRL